MTDAPAAKNTAAVLSTTETAKYDPLNGQQSHAAEVAKASQATDAPLAPYSNSLSGSETTAQHVVSMTRDANATSTKMADGKFDLSDNRMGATGGMAKDTANLNEVETSAGRPFDSSQMAKTTNPLNNVERMATAVTTELRKPTAGKTTFVDVTPGQTLKTTFDPNSADLAMKGKDLEMKFSDGSKIVLQGFAEDLQNLPNVALANGVIVAGGVIIAQLQGTNDDIFNLETAAGASAGGEGGGQFSYSDDLGQVINLLNKLPPIPFTALQFEQPEPRVFIGDTVDPVGGTFIPHFETLAGVLGTVQGGFEDWQAAQNVGNLTVTPMELVITFTPNDDEIVETVTISDIPAGVQFFYGDTGSYAPVAIVGGSVTFTAADLAAGHIFVLPVANTDADIPMTISMLISDPDSELTAILSQSAVAVVDAVADLPVIASTITIDGVTTPSAGTGHEGDLIAINTNVTFPDNDGSEMHTLTLSGVPDQWTLVSAPGIVFTANPQGDGTVTYTATVAGNVASTITFDPHEWASATGANMVLNATTTESVTDGEITTANNIAQVNTPFAVTIREDVPELISATPSNMNEHVLAVPGVDITTGNIKVDFLSDGPGVIKLTTDGLDGLGLTSHGQSITYSVSPDGQTLTATDSGGDVVFTVVLGAASTSGTQQTNPYTFTLFQELDHAPGLGTNNLPIPLHFTATDSDGDSVAGNFTVTIVDDVPVAVADTNSVPDGASVASGNVITNDTLSVDVVNLLKDVSFGGTTKSFATPDGTDGGGKFVLLNGAYGQIKVYENGAYTYTYDNAHNTGNHTETFNYTLVDFDGDTSTAPLTINIIDNGPGKAPDITRVVDETTDIGSTLNGTIAVSGATAFALGENGAVNFTSSGSQLGGALTSHGVPVTVSLVGGQYIGMAGATEVFRLTINNSGQYSFVLKAPIDQANGADANDVINLNFHYTASDADGDSVTGNITVNVRDDAPVAVADTNSVPDGASVASGNVITNDTPSKDVTNVLKDVSFGGTTKSFATPDGTDAGGKYVLLNGAYGQIKIYENGNYTYTYDAAHNSGNHTEVFNYTLKDFDTDTSATTLTINIVDKIPQIVSTTPANLLENTLSIPGVDTATGSVKVDFFADSPGAIMLNTNGLSGLGLTSNGQSISYGVSPDGKTLTATDSGGAVVFTVVLGDPVMSGTQQTVPYTFTLLQQLDHASGAGTNGLPIPLNFTATDGSGDSVPGSFTVTIVDDVPVAVADTNSVPDGATVASGNVITNDDPSVDVNNLLKSVSFGGTTKSFATPDGTDAGGKYVVLNGAYGQIKIYENGAYTYTYNAAANSGNHSEVFNYTLVDYDGDTSVAPLTINIVDNGPGKAPDIIRTIDETTDINASTNGTITVAGATLFSLGTVTGTAEFTSGGSQLGGALTSHGVPVTVSLVGGQYVGMAGSVQVFTLSITAGGQYNFVLKAPIDQANGSDPNDVINLNFTYTAKDADGDAVEGHVTINVRDDAPVAVADTNNVADNTTTASGNVITNDTLSKDVTNVLKDVSFGGTTKSFATPDGTDAGGKYVLLNGAYGQIKIYENGAYTYTYNAAANNGNHTEVFNYTLKDFDTDTSATTLTINIVDNGPGKAPDITRVVDETTDIGGTINGTIAVSGATSFALASGSFTSDGSLLGGNLTSKGVPVTVSLVGGQYVGMAGATEVFRLTINNSGQYSFVLKAPIDQANGSDPNDIINLNFKYTAADADGDAVSGNIQVSVKDDAPFAAADFNSVVDTGTATGNVITGLNGGPGAADTLSKDVTNTLKDVSFGGTTKSFATPDGTDAGGKYVVINGTEGQLKIYENGNYTYTLTGGTPLPGAGGTKGDVFNYTLKDYDGDTSKSTLTIEVKCPKLIVGENIDDNDKSNTPYEVGPGSGVIAGGAASDILVGDVGGSNLQNVNKDYNIVLILDVSGSMAGSKIELLKDAVSNLLADFNNYNGGSVKIQIVPFSTDAQPAQVFTVTNDAEFNAAVAFVNSFTANGFTNYEAPLQTAINWLQGATANDPIPGAQTFTYFVSDGEPNRYLNGSTVTTGSADAVMGQITGTDGTNEVATLQAFGEVVGVGIGVDAVTIGRLGVIDSGNDSAINVQDANDLSAALQGVNPINQLAAVGRDVMTGGDGSDAIYGDALNTDALAVAQGLTTSPGAGWLVFAELEANHGWSRADTIDYIRTHAEELARETINAQGSGRAGGGDTINAGAGNDIIFGQEGDDLINAGAGNDILSGGSGNNILNGDLGADTFLFLKSTISGHDTITDYNNAENDRLDISDLLVGSGYTPGVSSVDSFIKIDQTSGQVFVDKTGGGHFDATNMVATINGASSLDTVNVILNDSEGVRTVHTV